MNQQRREMCLDIGTVSPGINEAHIPILRCLSFKPVSIASLLHNNVSVFLEDFKNFTCMNSFDLHNYLNAVSTVINLHFTFEETEAQGG